LNKQRYYSPAAITVVFVTSEIQMIVKITKRKRPAAMVLVGMAHFVNLSNPEPKVAQMPQTRSAI
jgi:hypothetical protein